MLEWDQSKIEAAMKEIEDYKFDMDIVNDIFRNYTLILPGDYCTLNSHLEDNWLPAWFEGNEWAKEKEESQHNKRAEVTLDKPDQSITISERGINKRNIVRVAAGRSRRPREIPEDKNVDELPELSPQQKEEQETLREYQASLNKENLKPQHDESEPIYLRPADPAAAPAEAPVELSSEEQKDKDKSELRWRRHNLMETLQKVYDEEVKVLHFTAIGKPWSVTENDVRNSKPDAHPLLAEHFRTWRMKAKEVCPGFENIKI